MFSLSSEPGLSIVQFVCRAAAELTEVILAA